MGQCLSGPNTTVELHNLVEHQNHQDEVALTTNRITKLLSLVAHELHEKKKQISIVAIGGAVNTVLLHSRESTTDVDFFYNTKTRNEDVTAVIEAAKKVAKTEGLSDQWLNNHTAVFIQPDAIGQLYEDAIRLNRRIFTAPGLTVLAAPWNYALVTKIDRLEKPGAKSHDLADAVTYLRELACSQKILQRLKQGYESKYDTHAPEFIYQSQSHLSAARRDIRPMTRR